MFSPAGGSTGIKGNYTNDAQTSNGGLWIGRAFIVVWGSNFSHVKILCMDFLRFTFQLTGFIFRVLNLLGLGVSLRLSEN